MIEAHGYAVIDNGAINIRSVSPTRIGAAVNFLLTNRGVLVMDTTNDDEIRVVWKEKRGDALIVPVRITKVEIE